MNKRIFRRLSGREREEISRGIARGMTQKEIADLLGRNPGTISREINRNSGRSGYRAFSAGRRAAQATASRQNGKRRISREKRLRAYILTGLRRHWSPREIVKRMRMEYPHDEDMSISH